MSQPEQPQAHEPKVGDKFYTVDESGDEDSSDEEHEVDEVMEYDEESHGWNVGSDGDFYDIVWNEQSERWEEI